MVDAMRRVLVEVQLGTVLELLHAVEGLNTMPGSLVATDVAEGTKPSVAEGNEDAVVPYASMHDTTRFTPLL